MRMLRNFSISNTCRTCLPAYCDIESAAGLERDPNAASSMTGGGDQHRSPTQKSNARFRSLTTPAKTPGIDHSSSGSVDSAERDRFPVEESRQIHDADALEFALENFDIDKCPLRCLSPHEISSIDADERPAQSLPVASNLDCPDVLPSRTLKPTD